MAFVGIALFACSGNDTNGGLLDMNAADSSESAAADANGPLDAGTTSDSTVTDAATSGDGADVGSSDDAGDGAADGGLPKGCSGRSPSFAKDVFPILQTNCSGGELCHRFQYTDPVHARQNLVGVETVRDLCVPPRILVTPGDPGHSYILNKLHGTNMCAGTRQMPVGGELDPGQIQTIADWICRGALGN
jgi:hypothetical protein